MVIHHKNMSEEYSCPILILQDSPAVVFFNLMLTIETPHATFVDVRQELVVEQVQILWNTPHCQLGKD